MRRGAVVAVTRENSPEQGYLLRRFDVSSRLQWLLRSGDASPAGTLSKCVRASPSSSVSRASRRSPRRRLATDQDLCCSSRRRNPPVVVMRRVSPDSSPNAVIGGRHLCYTTRRLRSTCVHASCVAQSTIVHVLGLHRNSVIRQRSVSGSHTATKFGQCIRIERSPDAEHSTRSRHHQTSDRAQNALIHGRAASRRPPSCVSRLLQLCKPCQDRDSRNVFNDQLVPADSLHITLGETGARRRSTMA